MTRVFALALMGAAAAIGVGGSVVAQEIRRTELGRAPVSGGDAKEIIMQRVEFPSGVTAPCHFHNGAESVYVIEGGTVQVTGAAPEERLAGERGINRRGVPHAGDTVVGDRTVEILSVYVVDKGKPLQEPAP